MKLLAIDSATNACSAALWLGDALGPRRYALMHRGHGEALLPMVEDVMSEAGLAFGDLDGIAVTVGPGAFTGLRIGLAAARGLALAAGLPVVGVTTLEAVAAAQEAGDAPILVALDSRRSDVYVQLFASDSSPLGSAQAVMPGDVADLLPSAPKIFLAGDAVDAVRAALGPGHPNLHRLDGPDLPDAAVVAALAVRRLRSAPGDFESPPAALYLRPPDAVPAAERRRRAGR